MNTRLHWLAWLPAFALVFPLALQPPIARAASAPGNSTVVVVSLGGFRWDYAERDGAAHLLALGKRGASAPQGMMPSYPASTWPNLYTIVTGLYPGHHGIVADAFLDPARQARFSGGDKSAQDGSSKDGATKDGTGKDGTKDETRDGSWYGGTPLWSLAEHAGMRTACIEWPGCTAQIAGERPTYLGREQTASPEARLRQIAAWLRLPEAERPRLILARFDEIDDAAKKFGPDAPQARIAVRRMDAVIGKLQTALDATGLPIDLVVVSDHGVAQNEDGQEPLDRYASLSGFDTEGALLYGHTEEDRVRLYNVLKKASPDFFAYRLKNLPAGLHLAGNPRIGDPVIVATGAYAICERAQSNAPADRSPRLSIDRGIDGLNPRTVPEMKAVFFAAGPDIVEGITVAPFENVNLYPWLAHLLGLTPPKTDGSLNILSRTLRDGGDEAGARD